MFTEGKRWNTAQTAQTGLFHHEFTKVCRFPPFSEYAQAFQMGAWETPQAPEIWCCRYSGCIFPGNLDCKPWTIRHFPSTSHFTQNIGSPKTLHKNHRESATRSVNPHNSGQRPMWTTHDRLVTKLGAVQDIFVRGHSQIWGSWFSTDEQRVVARSLL